MSAFGWPQSRASLQALLRTVRRRRSSARSTRRRRSPRQRLLIAAGALALLAGLAAGGWVWLRDSSLVAVQKVTVTGESGPDAAQIRQALIAAARTMTTLDVKRSELLTAVAPYPIVKNVLVSTQFPHGMRIRVIEQLPVGAVLAAGREITVASDGTLLADVPVKPWFPVIPLRVPPGGASLTDRAALDAVAALSAAPYGVLGKIRQVTEDAAHGLIAELRAGPKIYFGQPTQLAAKWTSALTVLAAPGSAGAAYVDVTDPKRPASGMGADQSTLPVTVPGGPSSSTGG